ncbi:hypothetical protein D3C72_2076200 [compost metagenome]
MRALDQRVAQRQDFLRDRFQEFRAASQWKLAIRVERGGGQLGGAVHVRVRAQAEARLGNLCVQARVERLLRPGGAAHGGMTDEHFSSDLHD